MDISCPDSDDCTPNSRLRKGLCDRHYRRLMKHGSPDIVLRPVDHGDPATKWRKRIRHTEAGCWEWTAGLTHGYGIYIGPHFRTKLAHRYIYQLLVRPLTDDETLDHLCRNTKCVNPEHLDPVPHAENMRRGNAGIPNALKTHCKQGHPFSPENTMYPSRGGRVCRTCSRANTLRIQRAKRGTAPDAVPNGLKTHCKNGHEFTPENTYRKPHGRSCRACTAESQRRYRERKRAAMT